MSDQQPMERLRTLRSLLKESPADDGDLSALASKHGIRLPSAVGRLLQIAVPDADRFVFLGYEVMTPAEVAACLVDKDRGQGFYGQYQYVTDFRLVEDMEIGLEDSLDQPLEDPMMIDDLSSFLPVCQFQGDYIVVDLREETFGALLTIVDGHVASFLAPSVEEHVQDLEDGLRAGSYSAFENEVVFPTAWYQRVGVRTGKLKMDEFGDILD